MAKTLLEGGVIIYPTDSVYAFGCSIKSPKAMERLLGLRGDRPSQLTIACEDLSVAAEYAKIDNATFRVLKRNLPGPFTFVLNASSRVPDKALARRKTLGIRIPANPVAMAIIRALGCPMITSSVKNEEHEYTTDPELIDEIYSSRVDFIVDGGYGSTMATALVDMTDGEPQILREGSKELIY